jgi:3-phosphoinositide dependent protein kinase-1
MNQQHLIAEKKAKYAVIERDALIRLSQPRGTSMSPTTRHVRGASGSSARRKSNASVAGSAKDIGVAKERLSIAISDSSSGSGPLSPTLLSGRRPSRSAEPPTVVLERSEEVADRPRSPMMRSRPPSPVKEETSSQGHGDEEPITPGRLSHERNPPYSRTSVSPDPIKSSATPKKRRTSFAPSERSVKTISAGRSGMGPAHPGVIRLYSTFNDKMSLCT